MAAQAIKFRAPAGGWDENGAGVAIPATHGLQLKNMLSAGPGRVTMRGPLINGVAPSGSIPSTFGYIGGLTFDDKVAAQTLVGYCVFDLSALTATQVNFNIALGTRFARVRDNVYGSNLTAGGSGGYGGGRSPSMPNNTGINNLVRWDGTAAVAGFTSYTTTNSPRGVIDFSSYLDRLFALGGRVPGEPDTNKVYRGNLYWSDIGGPVTDTLALWQDDVSGLVNQIRLDEGEYNYGVGLAKTQSGLLILRRRSVDILTGRTPSNFAVRRVLSVGCRATDSIVEYNDGVLFMSDDGYMWYDGSSARNVSEAVNPSLMAAVRAAGAYVRCTLIGEDAILLTVLHTSFNQVTSVAWSGILDIPNNAWSDFTSSILAFGRPLWAGRTQNFPYVLDGNAIYDASFVTQPLAADVALRGTETQVPGAAKSIIAAEMKTRVEVLATPANKTVLRRAMPTYVLRTDVASNADWSVTVEDSAGNVLMPATTHGPQTNPAAAPQRLFGVVDGFAEANEVYMHWTYESSALRAAYDAEIHDSLVEAEVGQKTTG